MRIGSLRNDTTKADSFGLVATGELEPIGGSPPPPLVVTWGKTPWTLMATCKVNGIGIPTGGDEVVWRGDTHNGGLYAVNWRATLNALEGDQVECWTDGSYSGPIAGGRPLPVGRMQTPIVIGPQPPKPTRRSHHIWFIFFPEMAPVILHGKRWMFPEGDGVGEPHHEAEANVSASNLLIPRDTAASVRWLGPKPQ
jgi:hypothetical protein